MSLAHLLTDTYIHMPPAQVLSDIAEAHATTRPANAPHSIAEIVAHLDFWQNWILHRVHGQADPMVQQAALGWPSVQTGQWDTLRSRFLTGLQQAAELSTGNVSLPLHPPIEFPAMAEYTIGDALQHVAMHNSHHLGQVVLLRQMLGIWPPPAGSWTW
jgi:uncharacterized damage-inducible protein DinB